MTSDRPGARRAPRALLPAALGQLAPGVLVYVLLFAVPLCILAAYSFFEVNQFAYAIRPAFTFSNYTAVFDTGLYRQLIVRSVRLGLIVAAIVLIIGYLFAYIATFKLPKQRELLLFLMIIAIFGGYLVRIYAWRAILGNDGIINSLLESLGVTRRPLGFLLFSQFAVVVTLVNFLLPFGVLPLYSAMQNIPPETIEAARDLGGGPVAIFRTVVLPLTETGCRIAFAFAFVLASGDYVTPTLVGGANGLLIGNAISDQFTVQFNWPLGAALAVTMLLVALGVYWLFGRALRLVVR